MANGIALTPETDEILRRSGMSEADIARLHTMDPSAPPSSGLQVPSPTTRLGRQLYGGGQTYEGRTGLERFTPTHALAPRSYVAPAAPAGNALAPQAPVSLQPTDPDTGGFVPPFQQPGLDWQHETRALRRRAGDMLTDMPVNLRNTVTLSSGYRTAQEQQHLRERAAAGDPHVHMPAKDTSLHERGLAADFATDSPEALEWMHQHAPDYGLDFPFKADAGHVQLAEWTKDGTPVPQKYQGDITPPSEDQQFARSEGGGPGAATGRGMLSPQQIYNYAIHSGFSPDAARTMTAIALHESGGGNPYQYNADDPHGGSFGLTQINGAHPGARSAMGNPQTAMDLAYQISHGGADFTPWGSYTNGRYQQYLPQVAGLTPGGVPTVVAPPVLTSWGGAMGIPGLPGGPGGPTPAPGTPGSPHYVPPVQVASAGLSDVPGGGPSSDVGGPAGGAAGDWQPPGEMTGHQMLALAGMMMAQRIRGVPVGYDVMKQPIGVAPRFPSSALAYSPVGGLTEDPGRLAAQFQPRRAEAPAMQPSPFYQLMGVGNPAAASRARAIQYAAMGTQPLPVE